MNQQSDRPFTLFFVRHGVTEPNFRGYRCGGDLDIPLMDIGCDQAYLLAKQIDKMNLRVGVIVTGTLVRTRQTSSIISGVLGNVPIEIDPLLNERRLGQWNNRPIAETESQLAAGMTPPGGESEADFRGRIDSHEWSVLHARLRDDSPEPSQAATKPGAKSKAAVAA